MGVKIRRMTSVLSFTVLLVIINMIIVHFALFKVMLFFTFFV